MTLNKANLRDLIAASSQVILLKLDSNCWFFSPCDLEIWWMTLKNNVAPFLCYINLCAPFRSHRWIQTGVTIWKRPIWVKINNFLSRVTLKLDGWPRKTNTAPLLCYFKLYASFHSHQWIKTWVTVIQTGVNARKHSNFAKIWPLWHWTLTSNQDLLHGNYFC